MSYDLMVFDPDIAPQKDQIERWFPDVMEGAEGYDSADPSSGKSVRLRAFYEDMRSKFPAMNGPDQTEDVDDDRVTGYDFHPGFIYMDFRWSEAEAASKAVLRWAEKHGLGLFDPQDPDDGVLMMGSRGGRASWWRRLLGR